MTRVPATFKSQVEERAAGSPTSRLVEVITATDPARRDRAIEILDASKHMPIPRHVDFEVAARHVG